MDDFLLGIACIGLGIAIGYISFRHQYAHSDNDYYYRIYFERERFLDFMKRLDVDKTEAEENIKDYKDLNALISANNRLEKCISERKL